MKPSIMNRINDRRETCRRQLSPLSFLGLVVLFSFAGFGSIAVAATPTAGFASAPRVSHHSRSGIANARTSIVGADGSVGLRRRVVADGLVPRPFTSVAAVAGRSDPSKDRKTRRPLFAMLAFASLLFRRVSVNTSSRACASTVRGSVLSCISRGGSSSAVLTAVRRRTLGSLRIPFGVATTWLKSWPMSKKLTTLAAMRTWSTRKKIKAVVALALAIAAVSSVLETIAARRRQSVDPTSEWGRYADRPAARGQALMFLLMKLVPYVALPGCYEFLYKRRTGGASESEKEAEGSPRARRIRSKGGAMFADGLLQLGPLYIKIGQILSCRENLFPDEWITAMERLQDRVPAKSGQEALRLALDAFPGDEKEFYRTFSEFDDVPLAAASLGQVHRARLRSTNERVAIKVQRSRLRDIYDKDLALMKNIAKVVDRFGGAAGNVGGVQQSWTEIFDDAKEILYREIDYNAEAENAVRFAKDFGCGKGGVAEKSTANALDGKALPSAADWLRTPYTYKDLSSEKFLVMEYLPSIKISDDAKLDAAGVTVEDKEYLAESLARAYLRQFCANNFFSTDPHPGNLGVEVFSDGSNRPPRIVFYDFGQACSLSKDQAGGILDVIESIVDVDAKKSVSAFKRMGVLVDGADMEKVEKKVQSNYDTGMLKVKKRKKRKGDRYGARSPAEEELLSIDADSVAKAALEEDDKVDGATRTSDDGGQKDSEVMSFFTLQSEYAFVARAISQMDGVGKGLDPDFDFISAAAPYLVEVKGAKKYLVDEARKKLTFIYDPETGTLAREMSLFKLFGFDPELYTKEGKK